MVLGSESIPVTPVHWPSCYRVIPSRFPPIQLFERVADPADLEAIIAIESLTNDRVRDEIGEVSLVAAEDRVTGPGAGYIMAAFTHVAPVGGRFTDGTYGAYYAARDLATAIDETVHHRERFLRATTEGPIELDMRVLRARLRADLHDVRGMRELDPEIYDLTDYAASQALGRRLRGAGSWGVAYDSVRRKGGECAAVFRPRALSRCQQAQHLGYLWDGERIATVYEKKILKR
jgi:RES domain-containing protein